MNGQRDPRAKTVRAFNCMMGGSTGDWAEARITDRGSRRLGGGGASDQAFDLWHPRDADHGSGDSGLAQQPGNADLGTRVAVYPRDLADPLGDLEVRPAAVRRFGALPVPPVGGDGGPLIESAPLGAGQHAARQRGPGSAPQQCAGTSRREKIP